MNINDCITHINLSHQKLKSLNSSQIFKGLTILDLSYNSFTGSFDCRFLQQLAPVLKTLDISNNHINHLVNIPTQLQILRVSSNPMQSYIQSESLKIIEMNNCYQQNDLNKLKMLNPRLQTIQISVEQQYDCSQAQKLDIKVMKAHEGIPMIETYLPPIKLQRDIVYDFLDYSLEKIMTE